MIDYHSSHMITYIPPETTGWDSIPILEFLWGRKWDDLALAYVHSMNPTSIRVTTGDIKCDARTGRVTVYVDNNDVISYMDQEVEIGWIDPDDRIHYDYLDKFWND